MMVLLATVMVVVLGAAATALAASPSHNNDSATKGNPGKGNPGHNKDFKGLVDIGGGRQMYMECQGKGRPTVVFVAGVRDRAETWSTTLDPCVPIRAGGVARDRSDQPGVRLRPSRNPPRDG